MKPLPAFTSFSGRMGSLTRNPVRMIEPAVSSSPFGAFVRVM